MAESITPKSIPKDPNSTLDYAFDWSSWLGSDSLASHTIIADSRLTVNSSSQSATSVTVWLSGGTAGYLHDVTCRVTTTGGRIDDRTITLDVAER